MTEMPKKLQERRDEFAACYRGGDKEVRQLIAKEAWDACWEELASEIKTHTERNAQLQLEIIELKAKLDIVPGPKTMPQHQSGRWKII